MEVDGDNLDRRCRQCGKAVCDMCAIMLDGTRDCADMGAQVTTGNCYGPGGHECKGQWGDCESSAILHSYSTSNLTYVIDL